MKWVRKGTLWFMLTGMIGAASLASPQQTADDAKGKALVESKCKSCHDLQALDTEMLDKAGWKDLVSSMRTKGADLKDDEATTIVDYLARSFPPDNAEMKKLIEKDCSSCHDFERTSGAQRTKDQWADTVTEMISYGSSLKGAQVDAVADYLARHYGLPKK